MALQPLIRHPVPNMATCVGRVELRADRLAKGAIERGRQLCLEGCRLLLGDLGDTGSDGADGLAGDLDGGREELDQLLELRDAVLEGGGARAGGDLPNMERAGGGEPGGQAVSESRKGERWLRRARTGAQESTKSGWST
eukprot:4364329-Prymnesium_polylepis.2